jgi:DNA-binding transcriptional MerR regulator
METETQGRSGRIPDKLFYKAAEICQLTDTQPYVLRFWESEFPQLASEKNRSGQRVYRRADIDLILRIKKLLYEEEYTIAGARKVIEGEAGTTVETGPATPRGKRTAAKDADEAPAAHAAKDAKPSDPVPLFGESRPEAPLTTSEDDSDRYRTLYTEALQAIDALKSDLAAAATSRDALREKQRRALSGLEAALET